MDAGSLGGGGTAERTGPGEGTAVCRGAHPQTVSREPSSVDILTTFQGCSSFWFFSHLFPCFRAETTYQSQVAVCFFFRHGFQLQSEAGVPAAVGPGRGRKGSEWPRVVRAECHDRGTVPEGATRPGQCTNGGVPSRGGRSSGMAIQAQMRVLSSRSPKPGPRVTRTPHSSSCIRSWNSCLDLLPGGGPSPSTMPRASSWHPQDVPAEHALSLDVPWARKEQVLRPGAADERKKQTL